jgi:hypothetical protein
MRKLGNESFYFQDGKVANDLWDLGMILQNISQEDFRFHVNSQKNDFANWVQFSLNNPDFAFELRKTTDLEKTRKLISDNFSSKISAESSKVTSDSDALSGFDAQVSEDEANESNKSEFESNSKPNVLETKAASGSADAEEKDAKDAVETKPVETLKEVHSNDMQSNNVNDSRVSFHKSLAHAKHSLKPLILGAGFGIIVGMILMLILVRVGVF